MSKIVTLGDYEPTISKVKVMVPNEQDGELRTLANYSEKGIRGADPAPFSRTELDMGLVVEMDMDELAQSVAYLWDQSEGKTSATDFIKSMVTKSNEIVGDEIVNITLECLKACRTHLGDACISNISKGLEDLLSEYKVNKNYGSKSNQIKW